MKDKICEDCAEVKVDVKLVYCPYDEDINETRTLVQICDDCYHERSMAI